MKVGIAEHLGPNGSCQMVDTRAHIENPVNRWLYSTRLRKDEEFLAGRRSVSLSSLFSDACKRMEIATEQAMGCERIGDTLLLHMNKDRRVDFQLDHDEETGQLMLGEIIGEVTDS